MSTTFDQHVNEALALIAPARHPATATRPASNPQLGRPRLFLVRHSRVHEGSRK